MAVLVAPLVTLAQVPFSDAHWVRLNPGSGWSDTDEIDDLAIDSAGNLYACGQLSYWPSWPGYVARWDSSSRAWSALGTGIKGDYNPNFPPWVSALAAAGTELYAGGRFTTAGGLPATNIAKWNGSAWSGLGTGVNGDVVALAFSGSDLYAGGFYTMAGGVAANRVARWDGVGWSALGEGVNANVYALALSGTNLYAGGDFTTAGGLAAQRVARWDGSAWSPLGSGIGGRVYALAVSGSNLFAAGTFSMAGSVSATNIARWNGSAWSALGTGLGNINTPVFAVAVVGTNLYAGGEFQAAGGMPASSIARWDGKSWSALGSGVSGSYYASGAYGLASDGAGRLFVGGYFWSAGTNLTPYLAQANIGALPGRFDHATLSAGAGFSCTFAGGTPGYPYRIQTSPSLLLGSWTDLTNFTYGGPITVTDPGTAESRFLRAASP